MREKYPLDKARPHKQRATILGPALAFLLALVSLATVLAMVRQGGRVDAAEQLRDRMSQAVKTSGQFPLTVPAADFASAGGDTGQYAYRRFGGYVHAYDDAPGDGNVKGVCLRAPVYLPDGAHVNGFSAHVLDEDAQGNISRIELRRAPYRSTAGTELMAATAPTTGTLQNEIQVLSAPSAALGKVDTALYSYLALVCMDGTEDGNTLRLYAVVINYGYNAYAPLVTNQN